MVYVGFCYLFRKYTNFYGDKKEHTTAELRDIVANRLDVTDEERNELLPSKKQTRFNNRFYWAVVYLSHAKLLTNVSKAKHARYVITDTGQALLAEKPKDITWQSLMQYDSFRDFQSRDKTVQKEEVMTDSEDRHGLL